MVRKRPFGSTPTIADWGELRFLRWVRAMTSRGRGRRPAWLALSIGDDAAHLKFPTLKDLIVTTDALIEDVHFRRAWTPPRELGAKALAVNLSDLAAMAATPLAAFLSLGVPPSTTIGEMKDFFHGLRDEGRRWGCPLAGGDLVRSPIWMINILALGRPSFGRRVVLRSSARTGQGVYVTGRVGESAAGLEALERGDRVGALISRHNHPTPRLREAAILARLCPDLAMIDVSDGVRNDAGHLARESGVRIEIAVDRLPISRALGRYAERIGAEALDWALDGGEDYELLFATRVGASRIREALRGRGIRTPVTSIGRVIQGPPSIRLVNEHGKTLRRPERTFQHFA